MASTAQAQKTGEHISPRCGGLAYILVEIDPYVNGPTNGWQDQVIARFMTTSPEGTTFKAFGSSDLLSGKPPIEGPMYPNRNHYLSLINKSDDPDCCKR